jgi:hypothetical protein
LRVSENRVLLPVFRFRREEVTGEWKILLFWSFIILIFKVVVFIIIGIEWRK